VSERRLERRLTPRDGTLVPALIVESDDALREDLAEGLALYGFDVRCVGDAESGYALDDDFDPDVVLLDWQLPGDAGLVACRRMAGAHPAAAIVMLTEVLDRRDRLAAWEAGARALLGKPVAVDTVARELRRARGSRRFKRTAPPRTVAPAGTEEAEVLRKDYERLRLVLDTAPDAFVAVAEDGTIEDWNCAAELLFGWPRSEVLGRRFADTLVPARDRAEHELEVRRFVDGGESTLVGRRSLRTAVRRDGSELRVELSVAPLRIEDALAFSIFARGM
jgi:PAS domain S-box-containing protein